MTKASSTTVLKYGIGQLRLAWEPRSLEYPPMHTYKWAATEQALGNLAQVDASPFDDVALEYTNPHTGGSVMPSFACWIQLLRPGVQAQTYRHVGSVIYHVHEGSGETIINGTRFLPERLEVLNELPLSRFGKVMKQALIKQAKVLVAKSPSDQKPEMRLNEKGMQEYE